MLGAYITSVLVTLNVLYPAYECFKEIEGGKPEALKKWCIFWFVLSLAWVVQKFTDYILFWVPMYDELKLLFIIYLWHPKTQGSMVLYEGTLQPLLTANEAQIDAKLAEAKVYAKDLALNYWQRASAYATKSFCDLQSYVINSTKQQQQQQQQQHHHPKAT